MHSGHKNGGDDRKRQQNALANHELREREKQSDQLRNYRDLWLRDSEIGDLMKDLGVKSSDRKKEMTNREWSRFIGDITRLALGLKPIDPKADPEAD